MASTTLWSVYITTYTGLAIAAITGLLAIAALVHCALQKPNAFPAVGPLSKGAWLAILAGCLLLSALGVGGARGDIGLDLFSMIGLVASLVYLLDIRRAIKELGSGSW
ncbi:MAG TPA: DUF2516 family protein [Stackebrandtia sp.]|uniref:DUF2516 family protein n=1 Tax=Stackebrandtia sp. TaxID=2023065 RepID=UPI002D309807|nr:DUF2516 family protein [Stackebrandtia sp.]HZE41961.1 DUF2516 family protein [Stackebrandtia sp.]